MGSFITTVIRTNTMNGYNWESAVHRESFWHNMRRHCDENGYVDVQTGGKPKYRFRSVHHTIRQAIFESTRPSVIHHQMHLMVLNKAKKAKAKKAAANKAEVKKSENKAIEIEDDAKNSNVPEEEEKNELDSIKQTNDINLTPSPKQKQNDKKDTPDFDDFDNEINKENDIDDKLLDDKVSKESKDYYSSLKELKDKHSCAAHAFFYEIKSITSRTNQLCEKLVSKLSAKTSIPNVSYLENPLNEKIDFEQLTSKVTKIETNINAKSKGLSPKSIASSSNRYEENTENVKQQINEDSEANDRGNHLQSLTQENLERHSMKSNLSKSVQSENTNNSNMSKSNMSVSGMSRIARLNYEKSVRHEMKKKYTQRQRGARNYNYNQERNFDQYQNANNWNNNNQQFGMNENYERRPLRRANTAHVGAGNRMSGSKRRFEAYGSDSQYAGRQPPTKRMRFE